ncbi:MAG: TatD family hydrolase [Huintestinicola sp.]
MAERILENIIDSHAHYDDRAFDADRDLLLEDMRKRGLKHIVNIGCSAESTMASLELAEKYDFIHFAAGIHPDWAENTSDGGSFPERLEAIERAAAHEKCCAIGEIGLDYHYEDGPSRESQLYCFEQQLILAKRLNMPVVIHSRDACADTMEMLKKYRPRGVVHCFSGSAETAKELVQMGMYIGFTGVVTFKNARKAKMAAEAVPIDRLLIETDCPYMAPVPNRGQRNFSGNLIYTAAALAEIKGMTAEDIIMKTAENTERLFGLK